MDQMIRPEQAALNTIERKLARLRLMDFATYIWPTTNTTNGYQRAAHLELVAQKLEQVELYVATKGKQGIGRLMISMPPRTGKTETVSKIFPAWFLGRNPDKRVIITSYGADLAQRASRSIRDYVDSKRFRAVFGEMSSVKEPVALSDDSRSKNNWDLAKPHRGGVDSAGVGGALVGFGADLMIVDDPLKNREEAESESRRKVVSTWWQSTAYTRLEDFGAVVIVHTRWHPEDLAGTLLKLSESDPIADTYEVLHLPALALEEKDFPQNEAEYHANLRAGIFVPYKDPLGREAGHALWPEKYDEISLEKTRSNVGDYEFGCQYQQMPRPITGGFFDRSMFKVIKGDDPIIPKKLSWVRYVDLAMGQSERSDWNTSLAEAMDDDKGRVFCRGMLRIHDINEFLPMLVDLMLSPAERGTIWGIETTGFQSLVFQEFMKDKRLARVSIVEVKPEKDKVTRALPVRTRGTQGLIYLIDDGDWIEDYLREMLVFPTGQHDDQVDTTSGGFEMIAEYGGPLLAFVA
jgi:predicted phage terminase large subunit-like protein